MMPAFAAVSTLVVEDSFSRDYLEHWGIVVLELISKLREAEVLLADSQMTRQYALLVAEAFERQFGCQIKIPKTRKSVLHSDIERFAGRCHSCDALRQLEKTVPEFLVKTMERRFDELCEKLRATLIEMERAKTVIGGIQTKLDYHNMLLGRDGEAVHPLKAHGFGK